MEGAKRRYRQGNDFCYNMEYHGILAHKTLILRHKGTAESSSMKILETSQPHACPVHT